MIGSPHLIDAGGLHVLADFFMLLPRVWGVIRIHIGMRVHITDEASPAWDCVWDVSLRVIVGAAQVTQDTQVQHGVFGHRLNLRLRCGNRCIVTRYYDREGKCILPALHGVAIDLESAHWPRVGIASSEAWNLASK